jgi:hypothetical protein
MCFRPTRPPSSNGMPPRCSWILRLAHAAVWCACARLFTFRLVMSDLFCSARVHAVNKFDTVYQFVDDDLVGRHTSKCETTCTFDRPSTRFKRAFDTHSTSYTMRLLAAVMSLLSAVDAATTCVNKHTRMGGMPRYVTTSQANGTTCESARWCLVITVEAPGMCIP